jgi:hypothetical protein
MAFLETYKFIIKCYRGSSRKDREGLKELIDEDFGLLELATTARGDVKRTGILFTIHNIRNPEGQLGINGIRLMAKMTPHQLELVPIKWKQKNSEFRKLGAPARNLQLGTETSALKLKTEKIPGAVPSWDSTLGIFYYF